MIQFSVNRKPTSLNKVWVCRHWTVRKKIQDEWFSLLFPLIKNLNINISKAKFPLRIEIYSYAKRPLDADNICEKPIIDSIKKAFKIDDTIHYIRPILKDSFKGKEDKTIIIIKDQDDK